MKSITRKINEAYSSLMIREYIDRTEGLKNLMINLGIDLSRVEDSHVRKIDDPREAFKLKDPKYLKLWIAPNPSHGNSNVVAFVTRANSLIDERGVTDRSKRGAEIGTYPYVSNFYKSNKEIDNTIYCLVIDLEKVPSIKTVRNLRAEQKKGALALLKNREVRDMNLQRYAAEIKRMSFSDGSEFDLGGNIVKYVDDVFNTYTATDVLFGLTAGPKNFADISLSYAKGVEEYLLNLAREEGLGIEPRYSDAVANKQNLIEKVSKAKKISRAPEQPNQTRQIKLFVEHCKNGKTDNFVSAIRTASSLLNEPFYKNKFMLYSSFLEELVQTVVMIEREMPKAMHTALSSRDIASIETVFNILYHEPFESLRNTISNTIGNYDEYTKSPQKFSATDNEEAMKALSGISARDIPSRPGAFNKKVQIVINSIRNAVA